MYVHMGQTSTSRLASIEWLQGQTGLDVDLSGLEHQEQQAQLLQAQGVLPTIGCEVEVKWSSLFPELAREYFGEPDELGRLPVRFQDLPESRQREFDEKCTELDRTFKPRYEATERAGIPKGNDAFWEFANAPTYHWQTLATEVGQLMQGEFIPEGHDHSFHITLGGVAAEGGGMSLILSGLELLEVTPERIMVAVEGNRLGTRTAWDRRGADGVRNRANNLALGETTATELRTLTVKNQQQVETLLSTAQTLTVVLAAYRSRATGRVPALVQLWPEYRSALRSLWEARGLPVESWGKPQNNPTPWLGWAACLSARNEVGSLEEHTIGVMREIVTEATDTLKGFMNNRIPAGV